MPRADRAVNVIAVAALALFVFELSLIFPEYGQICDEPKNAEPKNCATYDVLSYYFVKTLIQLKFYEGAVTALATGFIAVFTIILARVGRQQSRDTRILQRAYLAVDGRGAILRWNGVSRAELAIINVGRLPAYEVEWLIDYAMDSSGRRSNFPIDTTRTPFYGKNVLPPGTEMKRSKDCQLSREEVDGFRTNLTFYVWGEVRYLDGFGNKRFTRFCHRYPRGSGIPRLDQPALELLAEGVRDHLHGNDAD